MAAATTTALFGDDCITLDYTIVQHVASKDPEYQLLIAKESASD